MNKKVRWLLVFPAVTIVLAAGISIVYRSLDKLAQPSPSASCCAEWRALPQPSFNTAQPLKDQLPGADLVLVSSFQPKPPEQGAQNYEIWRAPTGYPEVTIGPAPSLPGGYKIVRFKMDVEGYSEFWCEPTGPETSLDIHNFWQECNRLAYAVIHGCLKLVESAALPGIMTVRSDYAVAFMK